MPPWNPRPKGSAKEVAYKLFNNAVQSSHRCLVDFLINHRGVSVNWRSPYADEKSALVTASQKGDIALVKQLLQYPGINVNLGDKDGRTPLHWASRMNKTAVMELLLQSPNININQRTNFGETSIMEASEYGCADAVSILLRYPETNVNLADLVWLDAFAQSVYEGQNICS